MNRGTRTTVVLLFIGGLTSVTFAADELSLTQSWTKRMECTARNEACEDSATVEIPRELQTHYEACRWRFSRSSRNGPRRGTGPYLTASSTTSISAKLYARPGTWGRRGWHRGRLRLIGIRKDATAGQRAEARCNLTTKQPVGLCYVVDRTRSGNPHWAVDCLKKADDWNQFQNCTMGFREIKIADCVLDEAVCESHHLANPDLAGNSYYRGLLRGSGACKRN